jgi:hypothetical protein
VKSRSLEAGRRRLRRVDWTNIVLMRWFIDGPDDVQTSFKGGNGRDKAVLQSWWPPVTCIVCLVTGRARISVDASTFCMLVFNCIRVISSNER